jgi:hypothetical protein
MLKRMMTWVTLVGLLASVLAMMPVVGVSAQPPENVITVNGLFYGDGDAGNYAFLGQDPDRGKLYYYIENDGTDDWMYVAMVVDPLNVNDNVVSPGKAYTGSAGWSPGHDATKLIQSDHFEFSLTCGTNVYRWMQDYVWDPDTDPNNRNWLSDTAGPDGNVMCTGCTNPPGLVSASSFQWNLNHSTWPYDSWLTGATLTNPYDWKSVDTPATAYPYGDSNVTNEVGWNSTWWNTTYGWEWTMVYEMAFNFTESCTNHDWIVEVITAHNSPSKDSDQDVPVKIYDYGDLPDWDPYNYPTTLADEGARHELIPGGPILGFIVDAEGDGQPSIQANEDDYSPLFNDPDEDGVVPAGLPDGGWFPLYIYGTPGATLDVFLDWNGDGDFGDECEQHQVVLDLPGIDFDPADPTTWPQYEFCVPTEYSQTLFARFRLSTAGFPSPTGEAPDGEVEDYVWYLTPTSFSLVSFTALAGTNAVLIQWETEAEINALGYNLQRADSADGPWTQLNKSLIGAKALGSTGSASYDHVDMNVEGGRTYYYRLVSVDVSGSPSYYGPITATVPTIGEPLPPSLTGLYRVFLPLSVGR